MFFCSSLVGLIDWVALFTLSLPGRRYPCPVFAIGCKHTMKPRKVYSGFGDQGVQPENEV